MNPTELTVEVGGTTYKFHLPSSQDMVEIDLEALRLRNGLTEGLTMAYSYSQNISMLNRLCVSPEKTDFGKVNAYMTDHIGSKVAEWLNSFSKSLESQA